MSMNRRGLLAAGTAAPVLATPFLAQAQPQVPASAAPPANAATRPHPPDTPSFPARPGPQPPPCFLHMET